MHFLEFERHQLLFCIEHSKVSDDAVTFRMLDTKQRHVEHGVRVPDETQSDPQVRGVFDDWSMCLGNLTLFLIEQFMICHSVIITKESRVETQKFSRPPGTEKEVARTLPACRPTCAPE